MLPKFYEKNCQKVGWIERIMQIFSLFVVKIFFYLSNYCTTSDVKRGVSGTITMGHPNPRLKHPQRAQNRIRHPGWILPKLGRPKPLQVRKAQVTLDPRPGTAIRTPKASLTVEEISASLEGSLPRTLEAKAISDSLEGHPSGPVDVRTDSASLEAPSAEPSTRPQHRSDLRLVRDHPRRTEAAAQPLDGTGRIYSPTTRRHGAGVRRC